IVATDVREKAMASTESEVRAVLENWSNGIRVKDIDGLMAVYSADAVYFDVVPPLRLTGADAIRRNFVRWFELWESGIGVEIRELNLVVSGDLAAAHMLHRTSGTLRSGREVGYWIRATVYCQRSDQRWLIAHEHVSLPVDVQNRSAVMDLAP